MGSPLLRPLSIGEILDGAFTVYRRHFARLVGLVAALHVPSAATSIVQSTTADESLYLGASAVQMLLQTGATAFAIATVVQVASETVLGREVRMEAVLRRSLALFVPLAVLHVLRTLALAFGFCCLVAPGAILAILWFAWAQVIVIEGEWAFFGRSFRLARDAWGKIFLVLLLCFLITLMPALVLSGGSLATGFEEWMRAGESPKLTMELPLWNAVLLAVGGLAVNALVLPFTHAAYTLLYYDQRVRKEGLDVELAARAIEPSSPGPPGASGSAAPPRS